MSGVTSGIIGGSIAVALLAVLRPFVKKLYFRLNTLRHPGYDRVLEPTETAWTSSNARRLSEEKSSREYPLWTLFLWSGLFPVILGMAFVFGLVFSIHKAFLKPIDPTAFSWLRIDFGPSFVLSIFLGIFAAAIAMIALAKRSTTIRDYLTYHYGWGYMSPKARGEREIYEELEHQIRKRQLSPDDEYNGDYFSNLIFERTSPSWKKWTGAIFFITTFFLALDTQYSIDIYGDKISTSPYFSLSTHTYDFSDVAEIYRECTLGKSDGREYPYLSYNLHMTDGQTIRLFSLDGRGETPHLDTIERLLPQLGNANIPPTKVDAAAVIKLEPTPEQCLRFVRNAYDTDTSERITTLFGLSS